MSNPAPGPPAPQLGDAFDEQGQDTDLYMGLDTTRHPVKHGGHLDLSSFKRSKATLDDHQTLVSAGRILQADGIIVGLQIPNPGYGITVTNAGHFELAGDGGG